MDNGFPYQVPPDPEQVLMIHPGRGRKLWLGILCVGTAFLAVVLLPHLDRRSLQEVLTPFAALPRDRPGALYTTTGYAFILLLVGQVILEVRYLTRPSRTRRRWAQRGIVLLGVWRLMIAHFALLAMTSV